MERSQEGLRNTLTFGGNANLVITLHSTPNFGGAPLRRPSRVGLR